MQLAVHRITEEELNSEHKPFFLTWTTGWIKGEPFYGRGRKEEGGDKKGVVGARPPATVSQKNEPRWLVG